MSRASEAPVSASFRDFVAAERAILESEEARQYWTTMLSDSTQTRLPRLIEAGPMRVAARSVNLSPELFDGLKELARTAGVPLKSVLLAAHLRVLSLLSGGDDVLTGVVSHGRTETKDSKRVLGLFLNTLPFRQKLSGGTWLELVQETFAGGTRVVAFPALSDGAHAAGPRKRCAAVRSHFQLPAFSCLRGDAERRRRRSARFRWCWRYKLHARGRFQS